MKVNAAGVSHRPESERVIPNAGKRQSYRFSFLKLIAEEARLRVLAGMPVIAEDALENAVIRLECARLEYNESRDALAGALFGSIEPVEARPPVVPMRVADAHTRRILRIAGLLRDCRGASAAETGAAVEHTDIRAAERIVAAATARFQEQQNV